MSVHESRRAAWLARIAARLPTSPDTLCALALTVAYVGLRATSRFSAIDGDGHYTWLWARSLVFGHDLDLDDDTRACGDPWRRGFGPTGHALNQWPLGPAIVWAPLLQLWRWFSPAAAHDALAGLACRGSGPAFAMLGSALAAAASLWLALLVLRRHGVSRPAAALALALVGTCSMLPYYAVVLPSYSHACTALTGALFIERWDKWRGRVDLPHGAALGALLGLAMLMRTQSALFAIFPLSDAAAELWRARPGGGGTGPLDGAGLRAVLARWAGPTLAFALCALVVESPYRFALHHMYGSAFAIPQGSWYMRWSHPNPGGLLFSSYNGLLTTTPLLYPAVLVLCALPFWTRHRALRPLAALFVLALYVNASVWDWWGEASFSSRRLTDLALVFTVATALAFDALFRLAERRPRLAMTAGLALALALSAFWNHGAMLGEGTGRTRQLGARPAPERWTPVLELAGRDLWERVGNPLAWPASLPFALWHGVHPRAFDRLVGEGFFRRRYYERTIEPGSEVFPFDGPDEYFADGFSAPRPLGPARGRTVESRARLLLPLFDDAIEAVELESLAPGAPARLRVRWSGRELGELAVGPGLVRQRLAVPPGAVRVGVNELWFLASGGPIGLVRLRLIERR